MNKNQKIAGLSFKGGKKENFFLALLEYYKDKNRWFLSSLEQVKDEDLVDRNEIITKWIEQHELEDLVVDFPLSKPPCETCTLKCPGADKCPQPELTKVREVMQEMLESDNEVMDEDPKAYERERIKDNKVDHSENILNKHTWAPLLSKAFKRKLKNDFLPYWNRPIDV